MNIFQRIRLSVFPGDPASAHDESGRRNYFSSLLLHFRPARVPERSLNFTLTWALGGTAVVLVFLLFGTGLMLKFVYEPFPDRAYDSILYLKNQVPFGQLIRNMHRWSANGLVFIVFLHFLRVFYTGAFLASRQFNWIIGLMLFAAVLLSNFTGYLLPWDQIAYWAITISTSMLDYVPVVGTGLKQWILGGTEPGPRTLMIFYAIHTAVLPLLLLFAMSFHFWRIRKANGLVLLHSPGEDPDDCGAMLDAMPHLIMRELAMIMLVIAIVLLISMGFDAPLAEQANSGLSPNPTKAPWYFMGIQEMLMHFHPVYAVLLIPLVAVLALLSLPYIHYEAANPGVWFGSRRGRVMAAIAAAVAAAATVSAVLLDEFVFGKMLSGPANVISRGLLPFGLILAACTGFYFLMKKAFTSNNNEAIQALFTLLLTSFVALTLIGVYFRGTGMQLMWAG